MSLTLDATASARIAAGVRGVAWLAELDFASGTLYYTTAPLSLVISGHTYVGLGALAEVSPIAESEDTAADKITLSLSLVSTAMLAAAIGNVDDYRGRAARLYLQLFDDAYQPAGAPVQRWTGYMDRVQVTRSRSGGDGASAGRIELECSRAGMPRARNARGLRLTHAQQQLLYPADRGLEYLQTLVEQPTLWLSKDFQAAQL